MARTGGGQAAGAGRQVAHAAPIRVPGGQHIKVKLLHAQRDFCCGWDGGKEINGAASPWHRLDWQLE